MWTKVTAKNIFAAVITAPRLPTHLNQDSIYSACWNSPSTSVQGLLSDVLYALDIAYEKEPNKVSSFLCLLT